MDIRTAEPHHISVGYLVSEVRGLIDDQQKQRIDEDGREQNRLSIAQHAVHVFQEQDEDRVE